LIDIAAQGTSNLGKKVPAAFKVSLMIISSAVKTKKKAVFSLSVQDARGLVDTGL